MVRGLLITLLICAIAVGAAFTLGKHFSKQAVDDVEVVITNPTDLADKGTPLVVVPADQLLCLTEAMYFEDRSSEARMRFIASVVLARVEDPQYPDNVCGVVQDRKHGCQFSYECDGEPELMAEPAPRQLAIDLAAEIYPLWASGGSFNKGHNFGCQPRWYYTDYALPENTAWLRNSKRFHRVGQVGVHYAYCTAKEAQVAGLVEVRVAVAPTTSPLPRTHPRRSVVPAMMVASN